MTELQTTTLESPVLTLAELSRQEFGDVLVEQGLISQEFIDSGALELFAVDEATGANGLSHLLIGDELGGCHHLPTLMSLGIEDRAVASVIKDPNFPNKKQRDFRHEQKAKATGVFKALYVSRLDKKGVEYRKAGGSTMFPNEWTTQEVLEAIIAVSQTPGQVGTETGLIAHIAEHASIKIRVVTDGRSGKIITGHPR